MTAQVIVYEIKSDAAKNAEKLFSHNDKYFYWNEGKFKNLSLNDYVFIVNKPSGWVLFTKSNTQEIETNTQQGDTIFKDNIDGKWNSITRFEILEILKIPHNWEWKSIKTNQAKCIYANDLHIADKKNVLLKINQLKTLSNKESFTKILDTCKSNIEREITEFIDSNQTSNTFLNVKANLEHIETYIEQKGFNFKKSEIINFYLSLKTKPFVILAGISGTGKTQLPRLFAEAIGMRKDQVIQIPVRPDWTDASDLIGYTSLKGSFISKPLTEAIIKAKENITKPHFFILDEMNLARVEHYFADFLSIIETRFRTKTSEVKTDFLLLKNQLKEANNANLYDAIYWPENLYLIGTVNMDETTYPFSRKVLDRANSIEMNTVELDWIDTQKQKVEKLTDFTNANLKSEYIASIELTETDKEQVEEPLEMLKKINKILKIANLHFAYRVRDEIIFYVLYAKKEQLLTQEKAIDFQIMQKILPRVHGSSNRTQKVIISLLNLLTNEDIATSYPDLEYLENNKKSILKKSSYPKSTEKLLFMLERFDEDRFTSFWV
ncbi:McrB family protein [Polaribacter sp. Hel_I_88]|uniref:McrB family protein n=1 Tax=Polaribacter sp. Hel_I_88 TaxID=1250006 RepID=UPI000690F586|nr:AAA family ATPase [Polaribacter sp. Hel_I_88]